MSFTITLTLNPFPAGVDNTQRLTYLRGKAVVSSGTYVSGGAVVAWKFKKSDGGGSLQPRVGPGGVQPIQATFFSTDSNTYAMASSQFAGGFVYLYNLASGKFQILVPSGGTPGSGPALEEMSNGTTIPLQVLNDIIAFEAIFVRSYS